MRLSGDQEFTFIVPWPPNSLAMVFEMAASGRDEPDLDIPVWGMIAGDHIIFAVGKVGHPLAIR